MTADGAWQWMRTLTRATVGHAEKSPLVQMTQATKITVETRKRLPYELDGRARPKTDTLRIPAPSLSMIDIGGAPGYDVMTSSGVREPGSRA